MAHFGEADSVEIGLEMGARDPDRHPADGRVDRHETSYQLYGGPWHGAEVDCVRVPYRRGPGGGGCGPQGCVPGPPPAPRGRGPGWGRPQTPPPVWGGPRPQRG